MKKRIAIAVAFIFYKLGFLTYNEYENYKFNLMFFF